MIQYGLTFIREYLKLRNRSVLCAKVWVIWILVDMKRYASLINHLLITIEQQKLNKRKSYPTFWIASCGSVECRPCFARAPPRSDARPPLASVALGASGAMDSASGKGTNKGYCCNSSSRRRLLFAGNHHIRIRRPPWRRSSPAISDRGARSM